MTAESGSSCTGLAGIGIAYFQWRYGDAEGDIQGDFILQIDDNSDFSSREVDRTFDNLSYPAGTLNQQVVFVKIDPTIPSGDYLNYNVDYYWRVMVRQQILGLTSGWILSEQTFKMTGHPAPTSNFGFTPSNPTPGTLVSFNDISNCYNNTGPAPCASYRWNLGDGTIKTSQNPTYIYSATGTYTVNLQVCDEINCCSIENLVPVKIQGSGGLPNWKEISPF